MTSEKSTVTNGLPSALDGVRDYYSNKIVAHGPVPAGVDWSSQERQERRFAALARMLPREEGVTLLDVGCGYGALFDYLSSTGRNISYTGTDISSAMITQARVLHTEENAAFLEGDIPDTSFDYVVASGIFNVLAGADPAVWRLHVINTVRRMFAHCTVGMGCNFLSSYSDADRKIARLYYVDPLEMLDFCLRELSLEADLTHHYGTWDFTIHVFKQRP